MPCSRLHRTTALTPALRVALSFASFAATSISPVSAAPSASITKAAPLLQWDKPQQSSLINALAQDKRGRLWVATEDKGAWMRTRQGTWTHFDKTNGLPDDILTALAVDEQGRLWAGTARSGVAVYNGRRWKIFRALQGIVGEHIFDISVCPQDGDVWLATNEGLTRWSPSSDSWRTYTKADGLKTEKVQSLAFARNGDIVLGTQAHGVWIGSAQKTTQGRIEYLKWRGVTTWDLPSAEPFGSGLPSNLINDVLTATDGTIYVATTSGLAWSRDNGLTWRYGRGRDYALKMRERIGASQEWQDKWAPAYAVKAHGRVDDDKSDAPLLEDYVTTLAQDAAGRLYVGHRKIKSYEVFALSNESKNGSQKGKTKNAAKDAGLGKRVWSGDLDAAKDSNGNAPSVPDFETAILPLSNGQVAIARYGSGLAQSRIEAPRAVPAAATQSIEYSKTPAATLSNPSATSDSSLPEFPTPPAAPTLNELNALLAQLARVPRTETKALPVIALSDDWTTRGDWLGRYGRYWANLCAMAPLEFGGDYIWGAGAEPIDYNSRIGLGQEKGDSLRYFVSLLHTNNPNSLEMPPTFLHSRVLKGLTTWDVSQRQSEVDDHGEAFSPWRDGFGIYVSLRVPPGNFVLSLYNFNKDGADGDNRFRDYRLSIRRQIIGRSLYDISEFGQQPEWARGRTRDFRSGVWKRFLVRGPQQLTVELNRNYSHNTILAGMTLDELKETPAPYFRSIEQERVLDARSQKLATARIQEPKAVYARHFASGTTETDAATKLFNALEWLRLTNPTWWTTESRSLYLPLARWYQAQARPVQPITEVGENTDGKVDKARLGSCLYALRMFNDWEQTQRQTGLVPARDVEKSLRWDEKTTSMSGRELQVVTEQLTVKQRTSAQTAPHKTTP